MIITIDGPVASGKSSTASALAEKMGYYYLNTGLMYRAMAWISQNTSLDKKLKEVPFKYLVKNGEARIIFEDKDITDELYSSEISRLASIMSLDPALQDFLIKYQQNFVNTVEGGSLVVEGRDAGSVIFPDAELKIYLTASEEVRAKRWLADPKRKNSQVSLPEAIHIIRKRDKRDSEREYNPLIIPDGAIVVDSSEESLTLDQVVNKIIKLSRRSS